MAKTILIAGYGPGISDAMARKFAREGYQVALVARRAEHVQRAAAALQASGVRAQGFSCDLGDTAAVQRLIGDVRAALGPISVLHWNAYSHAAGDLTRCELGEAQSVLNVAVMGLIGAVQAILPDLRAAAAGEAAVLVTGGGFALYEPAIDALAVKFQGMGLSMAKAAQHKLVGVLHAKLAPENIFVGEVTVLGIVKGSAYDRDGRGTIEASAVADRFFALSRERGAAYAQVG